MLDKLEGIIAFNPNNDTIRQRPAVARPQRVSPDIDSLAQDFIRNTPARSRQTSAHNSPINRHLPQQTPPFAYEISPLKNELMTPSQSPNEAPVYRILFDEETTQAEFFNRVYARRNIKSQVIERISLDLVQPTPISDSIKPMRAKLSKEDKESQIKLRKREILMAIFVEGDDNQSLATLFQHLKLPDNTFDLNIRIDDTSSTPLHWAAGCARLSLVASLILNGADPNIYAYNGETPLMRAVYTTRNYEKKSFSALIKHLQQSLYARDSHSRTVLHHISILSQCKPKRNMAAYYFKCAANHIAAARTLVSKANDILGTPSASESAFIEFINLKDAFDETALHIAARYKMYRIVDILLQMGASTSVVNRSGETFQVMVLDDMRLQRLLKRKTMV